MKFYRFQVEPALRIIKVVEMTSCGLKQSPFFDISNLVLSPSALLRVNSSEGECERSGTRGVISNERERSRFLVLLEMTLVLLMK